MNTKVSVFHRDIQHEKTMYENPSAQRECFVNCLRVLGYLVETQTGVVYMASQRNGGRMFGHVKTRKTLFNNARLVSALLIPT